MICSIGFELVTPWRKKALSSKKERSMRFPQPTSFCGNAIVIVRHNPDLGTRKS